MVCVTAISDDIIAMLGRHTPMVEFSTPLDMPMPSYDESSDNVLCTSKPTFGPHRWAPATRIPICEAKQTSSSSYSSGASSKKSV